MSDLVSLATMFCREKHEEVNQRRKYTDTPYYYHPIEVMGFVQRYASDKYQREEVYAAALLHDTVEDTNVTQEMVQTLFGDSVSRMVDELTDKATKDMGNRALRKSFDHNRLALVSSEAQTIKLADILSNIISLPDKADSFVYVYLNECDDLHSMLIEADPHFHLFVGEEINKKLQDLECLLDRR